MGARLEGCAAGPMRRTWQNTDGKQTRGLWGQGAGNRGAACEGLGAELSTLTVKVLAPRGAHLRWHPSDCRGQLPSCQRSSTPHTNTVLGTRGQGMPRTRRGLNQVSPVPVLQGPVDTRAPPFYR